MGTRHIIRGIKGAVGAGAGDREVAEAVVGRALGWGEAPDEAAALFDEGGDRAQAVGLQVAEGYWATKGLSKNRDD